MSDRRPDTQQDEAARYQLLRRALAHLEQAEADLGAAGEASGRAAHHARQSAEFTRGLLTVTRRCGDSLDYGPNTTRCKLSQGHDGAHSDGPRRWS